MKGQMKGQWNPVAVIVLILTIPISAVMMVATCRAILSSVPLDDERADLIGSLVDSILAIIALFIGAHLRGVIDRKDYESLQKELDHEREKNGTADYRDDGDHSNGERANEDRS